MATAMNITVGPWVRDIPQPTPEELLAEARALCEEWLAEADEEAQAILARADAQAAAIVEAARSTAVAAPQATLDPRPETTLFGRVRQLFRRR